MYYIVLQNFLVQCSSSSGKILNFSINSNFPSCIDDLCFCRMLMSKESVSDRAHESQNLSMLTSVNQKPIIDAFLPTSKRQPYNPFEQALMNSPRSSFSENLSSIPPTNKLDEHTQLLPLHHFIDDWSKTRSWSEVEEMQCDRTQLSISIPMAPSDFSSSSSSPNHEKLMLSPLRLSREFGPITIESSQRQHANWIPISWEAASIGGPLGEVLTNTNNSNINTPKGQSKNCSESSLNLLTDGWDSSSSPRLESSPTGVLQKSNNLCSLSSSTGSSPRQENHNPLTIPSL